MGRLLGLGLLEGAEGPSIISPGREPSPSGDNLGEVMRCVVPEHPIAKAKSFRPGAIKWSTFVWL
jgi:hypothetical protein